MTDINSWMHGYIRAVEAAFGERVAFIGLQGSYARGTATQDSETRFEEDTAALLHWTSELIRRYQSK